MKLITILGNGRRGEAPVVNDREGMRDFRNVLLDIDPERDGIDSISRKLGDHVSQLVAGPGMRLDPNNMPGAALMNLADFVGGDNAEIVQRGCVNAADQIMQTPTGVFSLFTVGRDIGGRINGWDNVVVTWTDINFHAALGG